jgi:hypothetical protein
VDRLSFACEGNNNGEGFGTGQEAVHGNSFLQKGAVLVNECKRPIGVLYG